MNPFYFKHYASKLGWVNNYHFYKLDQNKSDSNLTFFNTMSFKVETDKSDTLGKNEHKADVTKLDVSKSDMSKWDYTKSDSLKPIKSSSLLLDTPPTKTVTSSRKIITQSSSTHPLPSSNPPPLSTTLTVPVNTIETNPSLPLKVSNAPEPPNVTNISSAVKVIHEPMESESTNTHNTHNKPTAPGSSGSSWFPFFGSSSKPAPTPTKYTQVVVRTSMIQMPYHNEVQEIGLCHCIRELRVNTFYGEFELYDETMNLLGKSTQSVLLLTKDKLQTPVAQSLYSAMAKNEEYELLLRESKQKDPGFYFHFGKVFIKFVGAPLIQDLVQGRIEHIPVIYEQTNIWDSANKTLVFK